MYEHTVRWCRYCIIIMILYIAAYFWHVHQLDIWFLIISVYWMQIKFQTTTYLWHVDYPDECIEWGSWISNSKPMGKFKDDIEHIDTLMAQSSCSNPVLIKCATHGYVTEVSKDVFLVMTKTRLFLLNAFMAWVSEVSGAHKQTNIASNQVAC